MKIVIIGSGVHAGVLLDILKQSNGIEVSGYTDADPKCAGKENHGLPVLGDDGALPKLKAKGLDGAIVGLGYKLMPARIKTFEKLREAGLVPVNAIHPKSIIAESAKIGKGVAIMAGAVVNPYTKIGDNVVVNTGAVIDHDNVLEDHAFINPGAVLAGNVHVGKGAVVGMGACIIEGTKIGEGAVVGAGAVVLHDVAPGEVVAGVPAKKIK